MAQAIMRRWQATALRQIAGWTLSMTASRTRRPAGTSHLPLPGACSWLPTDMQPQLRRRQPLAAHPHRGGARAVRQPAHDGERQAAERVALGRREGGEVARVAVV